MFHFLNDCKQNVLNLSVLFKFINGYVKVLINFMVIWILNVNLMVGI